MSAPELLETIRGRGGKIALGLDATGAARIQISPRGLVPDLASEIQRFKPALLELLEGEREATATGREVFELARAILDSRRNDGRGPGFDFGRLRPFWRAANELTGRVMDSPTLAAWARGVLNSEANR